MVNEEEMKEKYMQLQMFQKQIEQISQQAEMLNQQLNELNISQEALNQLKDTKKDTEVLATIAPGIFIKTTLQDNEKLIINVGADTTVEKTIPQVIEMLNSQKTELEKAISQSDNLLQAMTKQAVEVYQQLETEENGQKN
jgi:prefoldin alpha subunit